MNIDARIYILSGVLTMVCIVSAGLADEVDDCINERERELSELRPFRSDEQGCETKATGGDGVRHSCESTVCYKAPPGWTIKGEVNVVDRSRNGSEYSISAISYGYNSFGQTEEACVRVKARSPHGHFSGRGWQKVILEGDTQKVITKDAWKQIARDCAQE